MVSSLEIHGRPRYGPLQPATVFLIVRLLAILMVLKVVLATFVSYRDYFPPNFRADFLLCRPHFFGSYQWAFYAHIIGGPLTLLTGLAGMSESLRRRWPAWHRRIGRLHGVAVIFVVAPSGLWMARYAATGRVAALGFGALAILTGATAILGWRAAVERRFAAHRLWMTRCFALLVSAVVLRVIGGAATVFQISGTYPIAAWLSWLAPLAYVELARLTPIRQAFRRRRSSASPATAPD